MADKIYKAATVSGGEEFDRAPISWAPISENPWNLPYTPPARAQLAVDFETGGFWVRLQAEEARSALSLAERELNGRVWEDACLEFFVNPCPEEGLGYLNFEANALGVMLLGVHTEAFDGQTAEFDEAIFQMRALHETLPGGMVRWTLRYFVPFAYIKRWFPSFDPKPGMKIAGNFYKCGDLCPQEHYLAWSPVSWEEPSFHRPECFGTIEL